MTVEATPHIHDYFNSIDVEIKKAYDIANAARAKGRDPEDTVDIPLAANLSERVEGLVSAAAPQIKGKGIPARIVELEQQFGKLDWRVAFTVALEVAQEKFCSFDSKLKAMETGIRIGIAYLTLGVVASPLEGFVELQLRNRKKDGKEYFVLRYSGPIRSAGGTAGAVSVIVADYIRNQMGYATYDPTEQEVRRTITELYDYHERVTNLQYLPSEKEVWFLAEHMPVQVDGDPSEKIEVSNYKDLERIDTNQIRSGMCLVMGECLSQKAPKVWKQLAQWGRDFSLTDWNFLKEFIDIQAQVKAKKKTTSEESEGLSPVYTYIKDLVAGRPVLGHPLYHGGFRLRYGRTRTTGYSCAAIHPATMQILNKYIGVGTQLKLERPGKAATVTACETIEGPTVKLNDGSVLYLDDEKKAKEVARKVEEIIYVGDILCNYGDFLNRAHPLVEPGYCEEWWGVELEHAKTEKEAALQHTTPEQLKKFVEDPLHNRPLYEQSKELSTTFTIPLHPFYTFHWNALSEELFNAVHQWTQQAKFEDNKLIGLIGEDSKKALELLGVPHIVASNEYVVIERDYAHTLRDCLSGQYTFDTDVLTTVQRIAPYTLRDKSGVFIGSRMGRPEKAKMRKLTGSPHTLFPVGEEGGRMRAVQASLEIGRINGEFSNTWLSKLQRVHGVEHSTDTTAHYSKVELKIGEYFKSLCKELEVDVPPDLIKGIKGTSNREHIPEDLAKGILRAQQDVYVNKDGTTRYDATQLPITHFRPHEIRTSVERLRKLGYVRDIAGNELVDDDQLLELKPQDIVAPSCPESPDEGADQILFRVGKFVDNELARLYGQEPYYCFSSPSDVVGSLVMVLAPHTSAAIVGRVIGFSQTQGLFAHPMMHAATRRDCDGDEACISLLMDGLLNFSRQFLPNTRGATQDAPLVLTSQVVPTEVDDMFFDVDTVSHYPKEFYDACVEGKNPWEVEVETVSKRISTPAQYEGTMFTHDTPSINAGILCSSYKTIPSMEDKLKGQMDLADKLRAVDAVDVAKLVIEKHLIRDIKGNLRKFSTQQFRCVKCNEKYRRPPLSGQCCPGGRLIFTVSEGSIVKYLEPAMSLAERYNLPKYVQQSLELTQNRVEGNFGKEKEKQEGLGRWFG